MTVVINRGDQGPRAHALVMGVGCYPHLENGITPRPDTMGLGQLTSPPVSALRIAEWLKNDYNNPAAQLGTLNLLVSDPAGTVEFTDDNGQQVEVETAKMANAEAAVKKWATAANEELGNFALLYFCGHGVSAGINNGLLMEDFGADHDDLALLENAIDIDNLHLAMDGVRARKQVYFIDACRNTPRAIAERAGRGSLGKSILDPMIRQGRYGGRDAPMFFACLPSHRAYGLGQDLSLFTRALLETLNGAGSVKRGGTWTVRTDTMLSALNETLRWQGPRHGLPAQPAYLDHSSGFALHALRDPPRVPVSIGCDPADANATAQLSATGQSKRYERSAFGQEPWELRCVPGAYALKAEFEAGSPYQECTKVEIVVPPYEEYSLKVVP